MQYAVVCGQAEACSDIGQHAQQVAVFVQRLQRRGYVGTAEDADDVLIVIDDVIRHEWHA